MNNWKFRFDDLSHVLPERPDTARYDDSLKSIYIALQQLSHHGNLYESDEPKVVVKMPASNYQKVRFNENYVFAFLSLLNGRKSTFIRVSDREKFGIKPLDIVDGGVFPTYNPDLGNDIYNQLQEYYYKMIRKLLQKRNDILREYQDQVYSIKGEWYDLRNEYYNSDEWKYKRSIRMDLDGYACVLCKSTYDLHVHHLTYENIGDENVYNDLMTVCKECHWGIHGRKF